MFLNSQHLSPLGSNGKKNKHLILRFSEWQKWRKVPHWRTAKVTKQPWSHDDCQIPTARRRHCRSVAVLLVEHDGVKQQRSRVSANESCSSLPDVTSDLWPCWGDQAERKFNLRGINRTQNTCWLQDNMVTCLPVVSLFSAQETFFFYSPSGCRRRGSLHQ